jgi:hypothetical protein
VSSQQSCEPHALDSDRNNQSYATESIYSQETIAQQLLACLEMMVLSIGAKSPIPSTNRGRLVGGLDRMELNDLTNSTDLGGTFQI